MKKRLNNNQLLPYWHMADKGNFMYDIIIVGGGPAGSTLARLLGKKYKILLLEKRNFENRNFNPREKCCGGLLDPDAQLMLARFGLGIPSSVLLSPQLFAVRTLDMDNSLERFYQRHYINIDREEFDKWLESIIPAGVDIINDCVYKSYRHEFDAVTVRFSKKGREYEEKAKILVGADGAFSRVRELEFGGHPKPKLYISIQEWFETKQNADYYGAIFDSEITDFYSWTIPKEGNLILGSALEPGKDPAGKFALLKKKLEQYGFEFDNCIKRNGAHILRPLSLRQICTGSKRVALVGEAAGFISPSSAEGISYAFKSALALSRAIDKDIEDFQENYAVNTKAIKQNIILKNLKSPAMYNKHIRRVVMKSGLMSIELERTR